MSKRLLATAAGVECIAGLALMLFPAVAIAVLLDAEPHAEALIVGRLAGMALFALGAACGAAAAEVGGVARMGTLAAITFYNAGAGVLLVLLAASGEAGGPVVWVAGILHLILAAWGAVVVVDVQAA